MNLGYVGSLSNSNREPFRYGTFFNGYTRPGSVKLEWDSEPCEEVALVSLFPDIGVVLFCVAFRSMGYYFRHRKLTRAEKRIMIEQSDTDQLMEGSEPASEPNDEPSCTPDGNWQIEFSDMGRLAYLLNKGSSSLSAYFPHIFNKSFTQPPTHPDYIEAKNFVDDYFESNFKTMRPLKIKSSEFRKLWEIGQRKGPLHDITTGDPQKNASLDLSIKAFQAKFENKDASMATFLKFCSNILGQWVTDNGASGAATYYSLYFPILNGSMMGKSKLVCEVGNECCLVIYLNLSSSDSGYPYPNIHIRGWILENGAVSLGRLAEFNLLAFMLACARETQTWLFNAKLAGTSAQAAI